MGIWAISSRTYLCSGPILYLPRPFANGVFLCTPNFLAWWVREPPEIMFDQLCGHPLVHSG